MFMGAVCGSCVSFALLSVLAPARFNEVRSGFHPVKRGIVSAAKWQHCHRVAGGACPPPVRYSCRVMTASSSSFPQVSGGVLGGVILGAGMAVGGACPGMVLPQVGTALPNAMVTVCGGLVGALLYGALEPSLIRPALLTAGLQCHGTAAQLAGGDSLDFIDVKLGKPFLMLTLPLGPVLCLLETVDP